MNLPVDSSHANNEDLVLVAWALPPIPDYHLRSINSTQHSAAATSGGADIKTHMGNHTFRATGITVYLKNNGTLEAAQQLANQESPRTTKLYNRRSDEISLGQSLTGLTEAT